MLCCDVLCFALCYGTSLALRTRRYTGAAGGVGASSVTGAMPARLETRFCASARSLTHLRCNDGAPLHDEAIVLSRHCRPYPAHTPEQPLLPACLHPAGVPQTNKTYFCDALNGNCYIVVSTLASSNYSVAKTYCEAINGGLVSHSSREKQLLVERWAA